MLFSFCSFGLSSPIGPDQSHVSGFKTGSPFYAAPEIPMTGRATRASDVYSFGVMAVELYR